MGSKKKRKKVQNVLNVKVGEVFCSERLLPTCQFILCQSSEAGTRLKSFRLSAISTRTHQVCSTTRLTGLPLGLSLNIKVKVKCSRYRPGVAQKVGRGIALVFYDRGTRRG